MGSVFTGQDSPVDHIFRICRFVVFGNLDYMRRCFSMGGCFFESEDYMLVLELIRKK